MHDIGQQEERHLRGGGNAPRPPDPELDSVIDLMKIVLQQTDLPTKEKRELLDEIRKARPALEDRWVYRAVIYCLGGAVVLTVIGVFVLIGARPTAAIPDGLIALGSTAIGALAGLLSSQKSRQ